MDNEFLSLGIGFGFFAFIFIILIGFYVLNAISLHRIADNRGSDKGWFAWVPILNSFLIPILVEDDVIDSLRGKFTMVYLLTVVLSIIPLLGIVFAIVSAIMYFYSFYILVNQYSNNAIAYVVIVIVTGGIAMPFLLFRIRNRERIA